MPTTPTGVSPLRPGGPLVADGLLAALVAAASITLTALWAHLPPLRESLWAGGEPRPVTVWSLALIALACLPVALRRQAPLTAVLICEPPNLLLAASGHVNIGTSVASLIMLYSAAAYRGLTLSLAALTVAVAGYAAGVLLVPTRSTWADHAVALLVIAAVWGGGRSVRLRRAYTAELRDRADRLERAREADTRAARAEERSRIARELHDVVAHHVSVMTVQAAAAQRILARNPEGAREALSAIEETGRTAMAEMRSLVGVLRTDTRETPERAPQPGLSDLPALVEQMREAGLRAQLWIEGESAPVPPGIDLAAYRLVQEGLTNSLRHAGSSARAWVTVRHEPGELSVTVEDDGAGPADDGAPRTGHGLVGIRERVALYGGILRIGPRTGGGFEVKARFPLKDGC
ncbi:Signal transduction histidine kinase [Sinosporangium album]|uniref:histidine kinase n=1 Tax=Sinosporangium album TaxID=504805 RepID=A0A1G8I6N2_9ACTN|nr:sensor histidine kinase [Sinosporangium album]SDI14625.1 Signal transduction histidine kinase [Sinosporangium album]